MLIMGTALLCSIAWGLHQYFKTRPDIGSVKAAASLPATVLYAAYQKNETAANTLFLEKVIAVNGEITEVSKKDSTLNIQLKGGENGGINCSIRTLPETIPLKGSRITIKGRCSGFLMDVNLVDCVLEKP